MYHPNVEELSPISLEKEHGSREFIPHKYARFAIQGIDDLISYIETHPDAAIEQTEGNGDPAVDESKRNESTRNEPSEVKNAGDKKSSLLREPKVPDRDS